MLRRLVCVFLNVIVLVTWFGMATADERQEVAAWAEDIVQRLSIQNSTSGLTLQSQPGSLIRWSNPTVGEVYGDSFLWLDEGRPAAFLSIYAVFDSEEGNRRLTFQSLSTSPLSAELDGQVVWHPDKAGVEFRDLEDFDPPGTNRRVQLRQHRGIARLFSGEIAEKKDIHRFRRLRLLSRPLIQYENLKAGIESGSLFAMVDGTDPEILLMIEAKVMEGERKWRYAVIRQNHRQLKLLRENIEVWEAAALAPPFPNEKISRPTGVYFNTRWDRLQLATKP